MSTTIIVDLDSSQLLIPPSINLLRIEQELEKQVLEELSLVLDPELRIADNFLTILIEIHQFFRFPKSTFLTSFFFKKCELCTQSFRILKSITRLAT